MIEKIVNISIPEEKKKVLENAKEIIEVLTFEDEEALDDFLYDKSILGVTSDVLLDGLQTLLDYTETI